MESTNPSQQQLSNLLEHYQSGRLDEAEKLATSISQDFPNHQFAWKVLGAVLGIKGRKSEAIHANQTVVKLSPQDAEAHNNLGNTLQELDRLDEAKASYAQAIFLKPDYAEAHNNLGNTLKKLRRVDDALTSYTKAISLKPDLALAHYNLGNTFKELERLDEAVASYKQAIMFKPDLALAHYNLGNALKQLDRLDEAKTSYRQAIVLKPDYVEAHNNLGIMLQELGRLKEAETNYNQAIALKPNYAEAHYNLGITLQELGRLEESVVSYEQAITLKPDYAEAYSNLGYTLKKLGRLEESVVSYEQAITLKPDYAEAHCNLGNTLKELGRLDESVASYEQAIKLKPDYAEAYKYLTSMKKFNRQDEQYSKMQELYLNKNISEEQRCHINFGLAKACEDLGNFEKAFQHYKEGNMLRKKLLNYNINKDKELFRQIKANYLRIENSSLDPNKLPKNLMPIFIVGMPRSGTTLVEQIISSHSKVTGAGELDFAAQFGGAIASGIVEANNESLLHFRHKYLNKLQNVSEGNLIVIDKMPQNFRFIGLLAAAFPEAKIIHVKRNPAAVCWSNYKQYFVSKDLGYCYALDDVISYYKLYENLMDFWTNTLSNRVYKLDYELLIVNQDSETRRLIEYLGLNWDEKCLAPQNNTRRVATASNLQIRKKVYRSSSEQWKKYQPLLNGAFDGLLSS